LPKQQSDATPFLPDTDDIAALREYIGSCRGCELYRDTTQAVFGEGAAPARLMLVGEQPGDQEDRTGHPFAGPAGRVLDDALRKAEIDRDSVYLTNVVKHFKFTRPERGKRRIHKKPNQSEITACHPWFAAELRVAAPELVVCLGATAAKALLGSKFRITAERGTLLNFPAGLNGLGEHHPEHVLATIHPSAVLRAPDGERESMRDGLVEDLRVAANAIG
jgi:DNA polymerase